MTSLYEAFMSGAPDIRAQFTAMPEDLFTSPIDGRAWTSGASEAVAAYEKSLDCPPRPPVDTGPTIITGQQPGLFTGPLYTLLKAVTAVQCATRLRHAAGSCTPVFWVAGDDHDFEEVRTAHFLTRRHEVLPITYTPDVPSAQVPMYRMPLSASLHPMIDAAAQACVNSEQTPAMTTLLHETLDEATSLSHWFALLMARLFENTGLRFFAPHLPQARRAALPIIRREIEAPLESTRLLIEQGRLIERLGFPSPIQRDERACNFFLEVDGRRRKVLYSDGRFRVARTDVSSTPPELLALAEEAPERFSPNVALRPIVQQCLFGPVAYVGGPGEIAYWAQLKPLFSFFDQPMPAVYPRIRAVFTTTKLNRLLDRHGLSITALDTDPDLLTKALQAGDDTPLLKAFAGSRGHVERSVSELLETLLAASPQRPVARAAESFQRKTCFGLDKLERALLYADREKRQAVEKQLTRLLNSFYPLGKPQERVFSVFTFLFEHGLPLIDHLVETLDPANHDIQEIEL